MNNRYIELSEREVREYQLDILNELDRHCRENNLKYFIIAGTLLGAVRHKGYIPWDDDIDVVMLRDDYEQFITKYYNDAYYVSCYQKNKKHDLPYAKLCKSHTKMVEAVITECELGVNIDIFPIDNVPELEEDRQKMFKKISFYRFILDMKGTTISKNRSLLKNNLLRVFQIVFKPVKVSYLVRKIDEIAKSASQKTTYCAEVVWGCGEKEVVKRSVFSESVYLEFEGRRYIAPVGWDKWLSKRYGEYMKLPPIENQVTHHNYKAYKEKELQ